MGAGTTAVRAVLDTNVVVSALVFSGRLGWLRDAWRSGRLKPLIDEDTAAELIRVLAYPKFQLEPEEVELLLAELLPHAEVIQTPRGDIPDGLRCSDPEDQKFVALAAAGEADVLVTGDPHLLELAPRAPFRIVRPAELRGLIA